MPDGDNVYVGALPPRYREPYAALCEDNCDPRSIAHSLLDRVGTICDNMACNQSNSWNQIAQRLNELSSQQPLSSLSIDWLEERRHVERIARNIVGNRRAMDLAVDECKRYLGEVQEGASFESHIKSLVQHYLVRVYDARFQYRTPLNNHRNGIDQIVFLERLNEVRPYVITTLQSWADVAVRSREPDHLRRPRNLTPRVEADTNLPSGDRYGESRIRF